jgi:NAD(P)-dependent dehydrogenase (short-subunit alcohol dehydrogenase family)
MLLDGRVAIVTGGGSGIGRATVLRMAREGAKVVVADISGDAADAVASEAVAGGGAALSVVVDVADETSVRGMIEVACSEYGGVDVLHNNAAAVGADEVARDVDLLDLDVGVWDRTMAVNVRGPMLGCKHAIPVMIERGGGSIINTTSTAAMVGSAVRFAYGSSKAALLSFAKHVATAYGKQGIRCNNVAPSMTVTPSVGRMIPADKFELYRKVHLVDRVGQPEDIANAVVWLASDESSFVTGQTLVVDGGLMAHSPIYPFILE